MSGFFPLRARHTVLVILFTAGVVSYIDRTAMAVALPYIKKDYSLSSVASGAILSAFYVGYAISQIPGGLLADRFGIRRVTTVALLWWSAFTAITGAASSYVLLLLARLLFGAGEGVFPACTFKAVAVWFPKRERGTANAIMLSASRVGSAVAPMAVVAIMSLGTWRTVFFCLFVPGLLISLLFWLFVPSTPRQSRKISEAELAEIEEPAESISPSAVQQGLWHTLRHAGIIWYCLVYLTFDFAYWGFLSWLPTFLVDARGFTMMQMGVGAALPFVSGTAGCIIGGWMSDRIFKSNRKLLILLSQATSALFLYLTFVSSSTTLLILSQTIAGFALNVFFAAFWALPMNVFPKERMGVISGVINLAGQIAAIISPIAIGYLIQITHGGFGLTFLALIVALLLSCALTFGLRERRPAALRI